MKKCLVIVDYQNDFVTGSLGFPEAAALETCIAKKIKQYRENGDDVIFTFDTHYDDYAETQEGRNLPVKHCIKGTSGHELFGDIQSLAMNTDKKFFKNTFGSDELYQYFKENTFESIEFVGVVSNICVISNAILAKTAQPETLIFVDKNCVASNDSILNKAALDVMKSLQINITGG